MVDAMSAIREKIVAMWAAGFSEAEILEEVDIHRDTLYYHLRMARTRGDPRATRTRQSLRKVKRRIMVIKHCAEAGFDEMQIAKVAGVSRRTVYWRLAKERS